MSALVEIRELRLDFASSGGPVHVLAGIDLDLARDRIVGIVGESGSGKSTLALSLLRLLPANLARLDGSIRFDGLELLKLSEARMRALRGDRIAMIFQDPMGALNPVFAIGTQLDDLQRAKRPELGRGQRRERALAMLRRVGLPDPEARLDAYPHQLSGGQRQRVMIAMALLAEPDLLIADEPTTALDVTIEAQIVGLLRDLRSEFRGTILFISHSLGLVAGLVDDVVVMYAGTVVETAPAAQLFADPRHPYTAALLACAIDSDVGEGRQVASIPGEVPDLRSPPPGCPFEPRCPRRIAICAVERPPLRMIAPGRQVACHLP